MLEATGGISPPQRRRRRCALSPAEREEISRGLATGESFRAIAARLGRSASTVCREVNRNGGCRRYRAAEAEEQAQDSEADGDEAELSEMEALAQDAISITGVTGKDAAALRHVGRM
jgi:IS30 family transposase